MRAGTSTASSSARPGDRAVVADVDDLGVAGVARERGDELRRGLAVERAAAPLEQLRLGRQRRVAVELEQLALDLGDLGRARRADELRGEHLVVEVEVAEVVRRDRRRAVEQRARQVDVAGELVAVVGQQVGQHVVAVEPERAHPGQVVEADLVDQDPLGLDAEQLRGGALEPDRDVAEPDGAVAGVEQAARDDPDRVREVDDPGVVGGQLAHAGGDLEHDRNGAQRLRRARPRRSSPGRCSRRRAGSSRRRAGPAARRRGAGSGRRRRRRGRGRGRP